MKKLFSIVLCLVCLFSFLSVGAAETAQDEFLSELSGRTYVELFPEFAKDEYHQAWLDAVTPIVGEDAAEDVVAYLLSVCMGSLYGEEAIAAYEADPESIGVRQYIGKGTLRILRLKIATFQHIGKHRIHQRIIIQPQLESLLFS